MKVYSLMANIGSSKYVVNYHDGKKTHQGGSPFFDIRIFKNLKDRNAFVKELQEQGYREDSFTTVSIVVVHSHNSDGTVNCTWVQNVTGTWNRQWAEMSATAKVNAGSEYALTSTPAYAPSYDVMQKVPLATIKYQRVLR